MGLYKATLYTIYTLYTLNPSSLKTKTCESERGGNLSSIVEYLLETWKNWKELWRLHFYTWEFKLEVGNSTLGLYNFDAYTMDSRELSGLHENWTRSVEIEPHHACMHFYRIFEFEFQTNFTCMCLSWLGFENSSHFLSFDLNWSYFGKFKFIAIHACHVHGISISFKLTFEQFTCFWT